MVVGEAGIVNGEWDTRFSSVEKAFSENFYLSSPHELGAALTVFVDGELVVNLWGGFLDETRNRAWLKQTPVCVFSCTKGVVSILAMRLVQAGLLDYDAFVADYWPEYGCYGKERTLVRHLLSHQAGLPVLGTELDPGGIWSWPVVCNALSNSKPSWVPGKSHGYHALTWGYLVGHLLERAASLPLQELLQREVCDPLGVNISFGLPQGRQANAASLAPVKSERLLPAQLRNLTRLDETTLLTPEVANSQYWRSALIPGANGHCSAFDLATVYQHLCQTNDTYLSADVIEQGTSVVVSGMDRVLNQESAFGMGFQLPMGEITPGCLASRSCWGHKGIYGATGFADDNYQLAVGYVMNYCGDIQGDVRAEKLLHSIYECL